jgi:hypothetical protein
MLSARHTGWLPAACLGERLHRRLKATCFVATSRSAHMKAFKQLQSQESITKTHNKSTHTYWTRSGVYDTACLPRDSKLSLPTGLDVAALQDAFAMGE